MPVQVERGDLVKIAAQKGKAGRPMPDWVRDDPALTKAYNDAAGVASPSAEPAPARTRPAAPARKPAATRSAAPRRRSSSRPGYLTRAFSPAAAAQRVGAGGLAGAGDGGGLLLAVVIYPLALATLKYGAKGPGMWFRAKWLNQPGDASAGGIGASVGSGGAGFSIGGGSAHVGGPGGTIIGRTPNGGMFTTPRSGPGSRAV